MYGPGTKRAGRLVAGTVALAGLASLLAGCSDIYLDRRETVALSAGDAIAANKVTQMVDPWPPNSGDRNIAYNGQRMQAAVERYRTNKVTQAADSMAPETAAASVQNITQVSVGGGSSQTSTASPTTGTPAQ